MDGWVGGGQKPFNDVKKVAILEEASPTLMGKHKSDLLLGKHNFRWDCTEAIQSSWMDGLISMLKVAIK